MKTIVSFLLLTAVWGLAAADEAQFQRIVSDPVLIGAVTAVQEKYGVACPLPASTGEVLWRCLNGPQCGYQMKIRCTQEAATGMWPLRINVSGFDDGERNDVQRIVILGADRY